MCEHRRNKGSCEARKRRRHRMPHLFARKEDRAQRLRQHECGEPQGQDRQRERGRLRVARRERAVLEQQRDDRACEQGQTDGCGQGQAERKLQRCR